MAFTNNYYSTKNQTFFFFFFFFLMKLDSLIAIQVMKVESDQTDYQSAVNYLDKNG